MPRRRVTSLRLSQLCMFGRINQSSTRVGRGKMQPKRTTESRQWCATAMDSSWGIAGNPQPVRRSSSTALVGDTPAASLAFVWLCSSGPHPGRAGAERVWGLECEGEREEARLTPAALSFSQTHTSLTLCPLTPDPVLFSLLSHRFQLSSPLIIDRRRVWDSSLIDDGVGEPPA
jgi:hypothetical protein